MSRPGDSTLPRVQKSGRSTLPRVKRETRVSPAHSTGGRDDPAPHERHCCFLMALPSVTPRRLGQRAPRDSTGQRGQSPPAASGSRAGRAPGPRPRLRGPLALIFVVLGVLLSVSPRRGSWLGGRIAWWPGGGGRSGGGAVVAGGRRTWLGAWPGHLRPRVSEQDQKWAESGEGAGSRPGRTDPGPEGEELALPFPVRGPAGLLSGPSSVFQALEGAVSRWKLPGKLPGATERWAVFSFFLFTILHLRLNSKTYSWQIG